MFKTALQTITWGDPQHHLFDTIFAQAKADGFDAVEIGFRRLGQVTPEAARTLLDAHGLTLSASHVGGNLADLAQAEDERSGLSRVLDYLEALDSRYLIYSGLNVSDDEALREELKRIAAFADQCAARGVQLLFHNHDWEYRNGQHIWRRLLGYGIETLGFAPDLGWAVKGGHRMADMLEEIGAQVHVLHFKDFLSWEDGQNTCHLGDGVVDFTPGWKWLATLPDDRNIWITAEQDFAEDNATACTANADYLRRHLREITDT